MARSRDFAQALDERQRAVGDVRVERGGRLVHQDDFGVVQQRLDQVDAGFLAGGQRHEALVHELGDAEVLAHRPDLAFGLVDPVQAGEDDQVFPDRDAVLEHVVGGREVDALQAGFAVLVEVQAEVADGAAVGQRDADEHLDGGRLAGAVGAEETDDLALGETEGDPVDGLEGAVVLGEVVDVEDGG